WIGSAAFHEHHHAEDAVLVVFDIEACFVQPIARAELLIKIEVQHALIAQGILDLAGYRGRRGLYLWPFDIEMLFVLIPCFWTGVDDLLFGNGYGLSKSAKAAHQQYGRDGQSF